MGGALSSRSITAKWANHEHLWAHVCRRGPKAVSSWDAPLQKDGWLHMSPRKHVLAFSCCVKRRELDGGWKLAGDQTGEKRKKTKKTDSSLLTFLTRRHLRIIWCISEQVAAIDPHQPPSLWPNHKKGRTHLYSVPSIDTVLPHIATRYSVFESNLYFHA